MSFLFQAHSRLQSLRSEDGRVARAIEQSRAEMQRRMEEAGGKVRDAEAELKRWEEQKSINKKSQ